MGKRFVIIGCGKIAHRHVAQINRIGQLVGACDPDTGKLAQFTSAYRVQGYIDLHQLFSQSKADVAVICSPNYLHIAHIKTALEYNLDVLCEKPLCISTESVCGLEKLLTASGKRVFLVLSARFHPELIRLHDQIKDGTMGKILSFQLNACWNRDPQYYELSSWKGKHLQDGGILYTQFSHYLDALTWCLGDITPIAVKRSNLIHEDTIEGEDTGVAILQAGKQSLGSFHWTVNSTTQNLEISLLVIGEKGTKKIGGQYMDILEYENIPGQSTKFPIPEPVNSGSHHDLIYDQLTLALANEPHHLPGLQEGLAAVKLIESIYNCPQDLIIRTGHA